MKYQPFQRIIKCHVRNFKLISIVSINIGDNVLNTIKSVENVHAEEDNEPPQVGKFLKGNI